MKTVSLTVPTPLRQYTDGHESVEVRARTVAEALSQLVARYPALRRHLYGEDGGLRRFVNVYLNNEDIRYLGEGEESGLSEGDEIRIVPSIAGGATASGS